MNLSNCPVVSVSWVDAKELETGWIPIEDCISADLARCVSVGYLVEETPEKVVIMATAGYDGEDVTEGGNVTVIPFNWVNSIKYFEQ